MRRPQPGSPVSLTLVALGMAALSLTACMPPGSSSTPGGETSGPSGSLDKGFGNEGIVTTDFTGDRDDLALGVALQADGKIVAAGVTHTPDPQYTVGIFALIRYLSNGEPDPSFGAVGRAFTARGSTAQGRDVVVTGDGKIVTGGWMQGSGLAIDFMLSQHLSNGQLDESFGTSGHALAGFGSATGNALALQPDGKILFTGYNGLLEYKPVVLRYSAQGQPDTGFGTDGKVQLDWGTDEDEARAIAVHDGKILVAGSAKADGFVLSRLNADGSLDASFGSNGKVKVAAGSSEAQKLAVAGDGTIVLAGDHHVMRFSANGGLDTKFGTGGIVELKELMLSALALQPDGKILVAGGSSDKVGLIRLKADGTLDEGFADKGVALVSVPGAAAEAYAMVRQPDGRIVLAGRAFQSAGAHEDFMLMRFWP